MAKAKPKPGDPGYVVPRKSTTTSSRNGERTTRTISNYGPRGKAGTMGSLVENVTQSKRADGSTGTSARRYRATGPSGTGNLGRNQYSSSVTPAQRSAAQKRRTQRQSGK